MSRYFSTRYLRLKPLMAGRIIDHDRDCEACGYNLRGLRIGGRCPECGVSIRLGGASARDALSDAPLADVRRLRNGAHLAVACVPLLVAAPFVVLWLDAPPAVIAPVMAGVTALWWLSTWLTTPVMDTEGARARGLGPRSTVRRWARWLQLGWPAGWFLLAVLISGPMAAAPALTVNALTVAIVVAATAAMIGLALHSLLLRAIAEWCCNDFGLRMFELAMWGIGATLVLGLIAVLPPLRISSCAAAVSWTGGLIAFMAGLLSLGRSLRWSHRHAEQRFDRDRRLRDRFATAATAATPREPIDDEVPLAGPEEASE